MVVHAWDERAAAGATVSLGSAARELGWQRRELEFAVQLGEVRSVGGGEPAVWSRSTTACGPPGPAVPGASWRRRVIRAEIERLAADVCAAVALRSRLRLMGTAQAAELLGISPGRFTRLARGGCVSPARFYVNRYRAVVWLYLAVELAQFAAHQPGLSAARTPERLRAALRTGADWRGRNWRARRVGQLLTQSADPWERAAASAAVLSADALAETVPDPAERAYLRELDPPLSPVRAVAPAVRAAVDQVLTADDREEAIWHQIGLATALEDARLTRRAPRPALPAPVHPSGPTDHMAPRACVTRPALVEPLGPIDRGALTGAGPKNAGQDPSAPHDGAMAAAHARPGAVWQWLSHTAATRSAQETTNSRQPQTTAVQRATRTRERSRGSDREPQTRRRPPGR
ncbi:DUF6397 family protein [Streptomyces zagrosensis]|uniref:Uncharacterized protein n=1 Tax=Streptomyces zagrosensis TaxID=1042984 RepID=A0A7W9QEY2_9ACTN|nr:DUF6397 family protein [Streptomyces zagrosensis]MBB5937777.1 hypothetical protein [Streptomyces zagrosensis]